MVKLIFALFYILTFKLLPAGYKGQWNTMQNLPEKQKDGPYVYYRDNLVIVNYIMESNGKIFIKSDSITLQQKSRLSLKVLTSTKGKTFQVRLKQQLQNENSEYHGVDKLLAISDIEGNLAGFLKLLRAGNVIDDDLNWKFGQGHLVLNGDFFDRGPQVTEVLWLIYHLEEKAKEHGGYVHFILGNHEIMNLSGDLRYVPSKYLDNARLLDQKYETLYDGHSELGRWLRTKNIIEKIGDIVFVHAGISDAVNRMNLSIAEINNLARPYYAANPMDLTGESLNIILGDYGPFWYRGYYDKNNPGVITEIDSTLSRYGAHHIATGHTIIAQKVTAWYNGKLLNTDVEHFEGNSEALLVDNKKFYRVNADGKRSLLLEVNG